MKEIRMGTKAECKVTGFKGIITGKTEYLNGCIQYLIQPQMTRKDKEYPKGRWLDAEQLKILKGGVFIKKTIGGVMNNTPSTNYGGSQ